jgi:hypothetical protein
MGRSLHLDVATRSRGLRLFWLVTITIVIDVTRTLQLNSIRRKFSALLGLSLRSGGRFRGFAGLDLVRATDWVHHMKT